MSLPVCVFRGGQAGSFVCINVHRHIPVYTCMYARPRLLHVRRMHSRVCKSLLQVYKYTTIHLYRRRRLEHPYVSLTYYLLIHGKAGRGHPFEDLGGVNLGGPNQPLTQSARLPTCLCMYACTHACMCTHVCTVIQASQHHMRGSPIGLFGEAPFALPTGTPPSSSPSPGKPP